MQHVPDHVVATAQAPPRLLQELRETLQRLRLGGPFYVLLWLLAGVAADLWLRAPVAFSLITFGFVALTVVRFRVHGLAEGTQEDDVRGRLDFIWLLLLVNAGELALAFTLPRGRWRPCLDSSTAGGAPADDAAMAGPTCTMPARSVLLLQQED